MGRDNETRHRRCWPRLVFAAIAASWVAACSPEPASLTETEHGVLPVGPEASQISEDARASFRRIFCGLLLEDRDFSSRHDLGPVECRQFLPVAAGETGVAAKAPASRGRLEDWHLFLVSGYGADCFKEFVQVYADARPRLESLGVRTEQIPISGLSSAGYNAGRIRDYLIGHPMPAPAKVAVLGYSKGIVDILEAITAFPELADRIDAVISVAGAVEGSKLADTTPDFLNSFVEAFPGTDCGPNDGGALDDLRTDRRVEWLRENPLPEGPAYYSIVTVAERRHISAGLVPSYDTLFEIGGLNDSQLLPRDQIVPGSVLLGYLRADHWAVALPIADDHPVLARTFLDENVFPRAVLLEAIVRFLEERHGP